WGGCKGLTLSTLIGRASVLTSAQPNAGHQARLEAGATQERTLEAVAFRVEPAVTQPAPPQTRTCAINAYGSSVTRVFPPLWRITLLPCQANQMLWTILGMGRTYVSSSFWNFSQPIALLLLRRLSQYCHAFSAQRRTSTSRRKLPRTP